MPTNKKVTADNLDFYSKGYQTGANAYIFMGPIWVEEVNFAQISTGSNKFPIYPYSSPYFSRLAVGKYIINGTISIPYSEPNYLWKIIDQVKKLSIQDGELENIIKSRMSIFRNTVARNIVGAGQPTELVDKVCREIELYSSSKNGDPVNFEMTIITGNLEEGNAEIEIFESAEIVGKTKTYANDDQTLTEMYTIVARRMPPLKEAKALPAGAMGLYYSKSNLFLIATEMIKIIVKKMIDDIEITCESNKPRTGKLDNTDKLALVGLLNTKTRSFGKMCYFTELAWTLSTPRNIYLKDELVSVPELQYYRTTEDNKDSASSRYYPPGASNVKPNRNIDLRKKAALLINAETSMKYATAVSHVVPSPSHITVKHASIISMSQEHTNAGVGSGVPPIILPFDTFSYTDDELQELTYSSLWNCSIGARCASTKDISDEVTATRDYTSKILRPLLTVGYVDHFRCESAGEDDWCIRISRPVPVDYLELTKGSRRSSKEETCLTALKEIVSLDDLSNPDLDVCFRPVTLKEEYLFGLITTESLSVAPSYPSKKVAGITPEAVLGGCSFEIAYMESTLGPTMSEVMEEESEMERYKGIKGGVFRIRPTISSKIGTSFDKSLYVTAFVFVDDGTLPDLPFWNIWFGYAGSVPDQLIDSDPEDCAKIAELLVQHMTLKDGTDDSCYIDFMYDWNISETGGSYESGSQNITIDGICYTQNKGGMSAKYPTGATCRIFIVTSIMPVLQPEEIYKLLDKGNTTDNTKPAGETTREEDKPKAPDIFADIAEFNAPVVELYNIVRTDVITHSSKLYETLDATGGHGFLSWVKEECYSVTKWVVGAFRSLINVFDSDLGVLHFPNRRLISPLAYFMRGIGFTVDTKKLAELILDLKFDNDVDRVNTTIRQKFVRTIDALLIKAKLEQIRSSSGNVGFEGIYGNLAESGRESGQAYEGVSLDEMQQHVYKIVTEELQSYGYKLDTRFSAKGNKDSKRFIGSEKELITPQPMTVRYGLTPEGYTDLMADKVEEEMPTIIIRKSVTEPKDYSAVIANAIENK